MADKYEDSIQCVYIDPPYNAADTQILYKNNYRHSSWLSLIGGRLELQRLLMAADGILCITIDDYELHRLRFLLDDAFGETGYLATTVIRNNPSGRSTVRGFAVNHEYAVFVAKSAESARIGRIPHSQDQIDRYDETDEMGKAFEWENFRKNSRASHRQDRPKQYYPLYHDQSSDALRLPAMDWDQETRSWKVLDAPREGESVVWPTDRYGRERVWRWGVERTSSNLSQLKAETRQGKTEIHKVKYLRGEGSLPRTWWDKASYSARDNGARVLRDLFGETSVFDFPKSVEAVKDCIPVCTPGEDALILDYFAGSGTTAHAVIHLDAEDENDRRYLLVEMGDYFDTVLMPRIKKVMFSRQWKDGKPTSSEGHSHMFKYQRLESYEDALSNIAFDGAAGQKALDVYEDDYLLRYMLDFEARDSETLLNVAELEAPFDYKLEVHTDGQTQRQPVDLPETFNYLIGLHVKTRKVYDDGGRRYLVYRGSNERSEVVVIWRDTKGWTQEDLDRDKQFVQEQKMTEGAEEVYVNGDSFIPGAKSLDPVFKRLMLAEVET